MLTFLRDHTGIEPSALRIADVDAPAVLSFLDYLEQQRGNSVRSRNIRLAAIRSFFRLVALRDPDSIGIVTRVLAIPMKREDQKADRLSHADGNPGPAGGTRSIEVVGAA